jgi:hypothetical protein
MRGHFLGPARFWTVSPGVSRLAWGARSGGRSHDRPRCHTDKPPGADATPPPPQVTSQDLTPSTVAQLGLGAGRRDRSSRCATGPGRTCSAASSAAAATCRQPGRAVPDPGQHPVMRDYESAVAEATPGRRGHPLRRGPSLPERHLRGAPSAIRITASGDHGFRLDVTIANTPRGRLKEAAAPSASR